MFRRKIEEVKPTERYFIIDSAIKWRDNWFEVTLDYVRECDLILQTIRHVNGELWHMYMLKSDPMNKIPDYGDE